MFIVDLVITPLVAGMFPFLVCLFVFKGNSLFTIYYGIFLNRCVFSVNDFVFVF